MQAGPATNRVMDDMTGRSVGASIDKLRVAVPVRFGLCNDVSCQGVPHGFRNANSEGVLMEVMRHARQSGLIGFMNG